MAGDSPDQVASGSTVDAPTRSEELHALMVFWRRRVDPKKVVGHKLRTGRVVSQEAMAHEIGVSALYYGDLERGRLDRGYSEEFLDRVAYGLGLNAGERLSLYRLALEREPAPRMSTAPVKISAAERLLLDAQPWPAWYTDPGWDLLALNAGALRWFPHMEWERNVMRWVFVYAGSRMQLHNWETAWARPMLFQMRALSHRYPEHEGLSRTIEECLAANKFARELWENEPMVVDNPDGHRRQLYVPGSDEFTEVEIVAQEPMRHPPGVRMVAVIPVGGYVPLECQDLLEHLNNEGGAVSDRRADGSDESAGQ